MKKKRILMGLGAFAFLGLTLASCNGDKNFTVKFYNGSEELSSQEVKSGYNAEVPTAPTSDGKIFNGWYADSDLTKPFDFGSIIEQNTSVYAAWVNEYVVSFKDGSKQLSTQSVVSGYNPKVPTAPAQTGKIFNGWYIDTLCTKPFDFGSVIKANVTVYAGWLNEYTVVFKDGNETLSSQSVRSGLTASVPEAPTKDGERFNGWYKDELCTIPFDFGSQITSPTTVYAGWVNRYNVVFKDGDTTVSTSNVFDNELVTAQTAENKLGYVFDGWCSDQELTQIFDFTTPITEPKTLYAKYTKKNYQYFADSDALLCYEDFSDDYIVEQKDDWAPGVKGVYNWNKKEGVNVIIKDGKLESVDTSSTYAANALIQFGFVDEGTVEGSLKYTPTNTDSKTNGGWSLVQFRGFQGLSLESKTLFALRTNNDSKVQLYFTSQITKDSSNNDVYNYVGNKFTYTPGKEYEIYFKYDFETSKLSITIDDNTIVEEYEVPEADRPVFLTDLFFITANSDTKRGFKVDDVAIENKEVKSITEAKELYKTILTKAVDEYKNKENYSFYYEVCSRRVTSDCEKIDSAETKEYAFTELLRAVNRYSINLQTNDEIKLSAKEFIIDTLDNYKYANDKNPSIETTVAEIKQAIDAATSYAEIDSQMESFTNLLKNYNSDSEVQGNKVTEYANYYSEKTNKLTSLNLGDQAQEALNKFNLINNKYVVSFVEDKMEFGLLYTCDILDIDNVLSQAKAELDGVYNYYAMTLEEYVAQLKKDFANYKERALENSGFTEGSDPIVYAGIRSIPLDLSTVTSKPEAKGIYTAECSNVDAQIELYAYKVSKEKELNKYVSEKEATLLMENYKESTYKQQMDNMIDTILENVYKSGSQTEVNDCISTAYPAVDSLISNIKSATEATIKFMDGETELTDLTINIVKGGKVTSPETIPTKAGFVFKNWYTDNTLATVFDFGNTTVDSNTSIFAGWYEAPINYLMPSTKQASGTYNLVTIGDNAILKYKADGSDSVSKLTYNDIEYNTLTFNGASKKDSRLFIIDLSEYETTEKFTLSMIIGAKADKNVYVIDDSNMGDKTKDASFKTPAEGKYYISFTATDEPQLVTSGSNYLFGGKVYYITCGDKIPLASITLIKE